MNHEWKVGEEVAVYSSIGRISAHHVTNVQKQRIILDDGSKWRLNGSLTGADTWSQACVEPMTDKIRKELLWERLLRTVQRTGWASLTESQLARIVAIIKEPKEQANG